MSVEHDTPDQHRARLRELAAASRSRELSDSEWWEVKARSERLGETQTAWKAEQKMAEARDRRLLREAASRPTSPGFGTTGSHTRTPPIPERASGTGANAPGSGDKGCGFLVMAAGIVGVLSAMNMNTGVDTGFGRVQNIGLLQQQSQAITVAAFVALAGFLLLAFGGRREGR